MAATLDYAQQQSLFFRLPREVRDQIYEQYVQEKNGYFYDFAAGKMCLEPSKQKGNTPPASVCLGLIFTCRIAADEMRGVPLRMNKITFLPGYSNRDGDDHYGLCSKDARFRCLLKVIQTTKIHILIYSAELMTTKIREELTLLYPNLGHFFENPLRAAEWCPALNGDNLEDIPLTQSFDDALQGALEMLQASNRIRFEALASKASGDRRSPRGHVFSLRNPFAVGSLAKLLAWRPSPWTVPSSAQLSYMESALSDPNMEPRYKLTSWEANDGIDYFDVSAVELSKWAKGTKWYFSATAVAIQFLQHLDSYQRRQLRNIVVQEDRKAVGNPASHARGFIPFCIENPRLHVERHIGLWSNMLPLGWYGIDARPYGNSQGGVFGEYVLASTMNWLEEASTLSSRGMPLDSFRVLLEGHSDQTVEVWKMLKEAAGLQEAMLKCCRRQHVHPPLIGGDPSYRKFYYPLPSHLPHIYFEAIKSIVQEGSSFVRLDGYTGEIWDLDELVAKRQQWSLSKWREEWEESILRRYFPTTLFKDLPSKYHIPDERHQ